MRFVLVGQGRLAAECSKMAASSGLRAVAIVTDTPKIENWAASVPTPVFDLDRTGLARLGSEEFDFLFSVNNPLIIGEELLSRAKSCCVNFHDSPLPGYAGLNATSWALLNGESIHGISWHLMEKTIDSGDVLIERTFEVGESESAFSLNLRCFEEALIGFGELLTLLKSGNVKGRRQERGRGSYFGEKDVPFGAGVIDFSQPAPKIERLSRALEFGPTFNPLCTLKVGLDTSDWLSVKTARVIADAQPLNEGVVGSIDADSWIVGTATEPILLEGFARSDGTNVSGRAAARCANVAEGRRLPDTDCDLRLLTAKTGELKRHELFWLERLLSASSLRSPRGVERSSASVAEPGSVHEAELAASAVSGASEAAVVAAFAVVMADLFDVDRIDLGFEDSELRQLKRDGGPHFASQVPMRLDLAHAVYSEPEWEERVQAELQLCRRRVGFARDLFLREPILKLRESDFRIGVAFFEAEEWNRSDPPLRHLVQLIGIRRADHIPEWHLRMSEGLHADQRRWLGSRVTSVLRQLQLGQTPASATPLSVEEGRSIIATATGEIRDFPLDRSLGEVVNSAFGRWRDLPALSEGPDELTHGELDARSSRVAEGLVAAGYGLDRFIGITTERSIAQIVGLFAIFKTGSGFVAIDPALPPARQELMASLAGARVILVDEDRDQFSIPGIEVSTVGKLSVSGDPSNHRPFRPVHSNDPAYVTFTSGSTGEPKGVCIRQSSLINFVLGALEAVDVRPSDRRLQFSTLSFDVAMEEILCTFFSGATLVLRNDDCIGSAMRFSDFIEQTGITVLDLPTAFFEVWVGGHAEHRRALPPELRTVVVGGQTLYQKVVDRWHGLEGSGRVSLHNSYGPAEATVGVTYVELNKGMRGVPIGKPLPNTLVVPVGRRGSPRPVGLTGEIVLSGRCLSDGYLQREELTRARFQELRLGQTPEPTTRVYRTGDFGWYDADGLLRFLGREDRQVKVRGFRIEIEEVEAQLCGIGGVTSAAVFEDDGRLFGAVVSNALRAEHVRSELASRVPDYMVPAKLIVCDHFRMSPNGKIDWQWLKAEIARRGPPDAVSEGTADRPDRISDLERSVVEVFADVLGTGAVGLDVDFFDYGGDSLGVVRLLGDLENLTGVRVPMAAFLGTPTPRAMAGLIERFQKGRERTRGGDDSAGDRVAVGNAFGGDGAPVFVVTPLGNAATPIMRCMDWPGRPLHNLDLPIVEASGEPVAYQTIGGAASRLVRELKESQPGCSECTLVGFSFGGLVVCEMAKQLEAGGVVVDALVLIDPSYPPVEMRDFQEDPRARAHAAGSLERRLRPPESLETLPGRIRHWTSILRERVAVRTRLAWMRLMMDRALGGRRWRRGLSADEELAWFLREVRMVEKRSPLQAFDLAAPVFILLASDSYRDDLEVRWRLLLGEDAHLCMLQGDHLGILNENRNDLGDRLRWVFDKLDNERLRDRVRQTLP